MCSQMKDVNGQTSSRGRTILKMVIEDFVRTAHPVASKRLKDKYNIEIMLKFLFSIIFATSSKFIICVNNAIKKRDSNMYLNFIINKYIEILFFIKFKKIKY